MRYFILLSVILLGFSGCRKDKNEFSLKGELMNLPGDTLYIYGFDEFFDRMDTIVAQDGKFTYKATLDTLTSLILYVDETKSEFPFYAERRDHISIKGDILRPYQVHIKGGKHKQNEESLPFYASLDTLSLKWDSLLWEQDILLSDQDSLLTAHDSLVLKSDSLVHDSLWVVRNSLLEIRDSLMLERKAIVLQRDSVFAIEAESFITTHPFSYFSVYLLDKYFVQVNKPDYTKIRDLINGLGGELQDNLYIDQLIKEVGTTDKLTKGNRAPQFSLKDLKDETYSLQVLRDKFWILNFWATWDSLSVVSNEDYKKIHNKYKKHKEFDILSIALDINKDSVETVTKRDTLPWIHIVVPEMWKGAVVENFGVQKLPYNILLDKQGRVMDYDIDMDNLTQQLDSLLK